MMKKPRGIWTVQEFQEGLEEQVKRGFLPLPPKTTISVGGIYKAYQEADNKYAKMSLLIQLAEVLVVLKLRNPTKRFDSLIKNMGVPNPFVYSLISAYTHQEEW
jgi:hypothetical protein